MIPRVDQEHRDFLASLKRGQPVKAMLNGEWYDAAFLGFVGPPTPGPYLTGGKGQPAPRPPRVRVQIDDREEVDVGVEQVGPRDAATGTAG